MSSRNRPADDWRVLADALTHAADLQTAFDTIVTEVSRALAVPSCIVVRDAGGWRMLAQARGGLPLAVRDVAAALESIPPAHGHALLTLHVNPEQAWSAVPIGASRDAVESEAGTVSEAVLIVRNDRATHDAALGQLAVWLPLAIAAARDRDLRSRSARMVFDAYAIARRGGGTGGIEAVGRRVVEQVGRSLDAERVALAVYRAEEDCLAVVAAHGYAAEQVSHARIGPGEWVMGHVYTSGRPVVVSDVRRLRNTSGGRQPYRTVSFAAVPIVAGRSTIGVLSATDKADGSAFDRQDAIALRTIGGVAALALSAARNDAEVTRLARAANVDSMTSLFNRPYFDGRLVEEIERARRSATSVTVLMADIDDFKAVNDTYGHPVGDAVLQSVGTILRSSVRVFDVCARYGGDEFAILMPSSDANSAVAAAERIRQRLADSCATDPALAHLKRLTISIGVAVFGPLDTPAELLRRADDALYRAKADGKDMVRTSAGSTSGLPTVRPGVPWPSGYDD